MFYRRRPMKRYARRVKRFVKKRYGTAGIGAIPKILRDVNMLKTAVNSERKYYDRTDIVPYNITDLNPMLLDPWDGLVQGDGEQQRIGDQVKALYTKIKIRLELNTTSITSANTHVVRCLVIADHDTRYDAPLTGLNVAGAVLADIATGQMQIISPYRTQQFAGIGSMGERWKIIRDFNVKLDNVNDKQKLLDITVDHTKYSSKRKGQVVRYDSADARDPNPRMYVLLLTDNAVTDTIQGYAYSRLCYVDN